MAHGGAWTVGCSFSGWERCDVGGPGRPLVPELPPFYTFSRPEVSLAGRRTGPLLSEQIVLELLRITPRTRLMLSKHFTTELHLSPELLQHFDSF